MRVKASASKAKPAPAVETSDSINAQIEAFLKSGGEIQQISKELLQNDAKSIVTVMKQMGLTKEEALQLISENWN